MSVDKSIIYQSSQVEANQEFPGGLVTRIWIAFTASAAWIQYLVRELRPHKLHALAKEKKKVESNQMYINWWTDE